MFSAPFLSSETAKSLESTAETARQIFGGAF